MRVVVLQSSYLPWKGYFDLMHDADRFVFYDDVQFTKNDWRNRNRFYGANGLFWITVPVPKTAVRGTIRRVELRDDRWQAKHARTFRATYGGAPGWEELALFVRETYETRRWTRLVDLNRHAIRWFADRLGCGAGSTTELLDAGDVLRADDAGVDRVERLLRVLRRVGATEYLSGPAARDYLDGHEDAFARHDIALRWKSYDDYPTYPQRRAPFEHAVSIVDLVAHVGFERAPWSIWGHRAGDGSR